MKNRKCPALVKPHYPSHKFGFMMHRDKMWLLDSQVLSSYAFNNVSYEYPFGRRLWYFSNEACFHKAFEKVAPFFSIL